MQNNRKTLEQYFSALYQSPKNAIHFADYAAYSLGDLIQFRREVDYIAEQGDPLDALKLLDFLKGLDLSEPLMLRINKIVQAITILLSKPSVRKQWKMLSRFYRYQIRGDEGFHNPDEDDCCYLGCCQHYLPSPFAKSVLTKDLLPTLVEKFPTTQSGHLLGLASFDPNGYIRQAALGQIAQLNTDVILPYVLLRLNDWVPQISIQAQNILENMLKSYAISIQQIVWCRYLIATFSQPTRVNLKPWQEYIYGYIKVSRNASEVAELLNSKMDLNDKAFLKDAT